MAHHHLNPMYEKLICRSNGMSIGSQGIYEVPEEISEESEHEEESCKRSSRGEESEDREREIGPILLARPADHLKEDKLSVPNSR